MTYFLFVSIINFIFVYHSEHLNDIWIFSLVEKCPPLHQIINDTCIPLLTCSQSSSNIDNCELKCNSQLNNTFNDQDTTCTIDGDMIINGSIVETNVITIVGTVNVSGNVIVAEAMTVKLNVGSTLHVDKCLVLDEGSEIIVVVGNDMTDDVTSGNDGGDDGGSVLLATYDGRCSSELTNHVRIERTSSFDECRDGQPKVQQMKDESGKTRLELVFVPISESSECIGSEVNILVIAVVVPVVVLVIVVIVVVMTVPTLRAKVFPFAKRRN